MEDTSQIQKSINPGGSEFNKIRVIIRVRPFLEGEHEEKSIQPSIKYREDTNEVE